MKRLPIIALITQLFIVSGCEFQTEQSSSEIRRGPENSFFAGGLDGGVFVKISAPDPGEDVYRGKLFYENGDLLYAGTFNYSAPDKSFDPSDPNLYSGWDGTRLYLRDNTYLTPLEEIPPL